MKLNAPIQSTPQNIRRYIFLKDVFWLAISAFGGPQAHIAMMLQLLVEKRKYISEEELIELQALCQILPGPTSTQTITAIAFRKGGSVLALMTLFVWILPAATFMTLAGIGLHHLQKHNISIEFTKFIKPIAVGFVAFAAYKISFKLIKTKTQFTLMAISALISWLYNQPWLFPSLIVCGGIITGARYKHLEKTLNKSSIRIEWKNLILFFLVFGAAVLVSKTTELLPAQLFESFYRNGSLIFGGGQVLVPYLQNEFVLTKQLVTNDEFLTGFGLVQAMPGPVFSFSAFIGATSAKDLGILNMVLSGYISAIGVFLPGALLIFFVIKFWDELKQYRVVKASLFGINAVSCGLIIAAFFLLFTPLSDQWENYLIMIATFLILKHTKLQAPYIIIIGLVAGYLATLI